MNVLVFAEASINDVKYNHCLPKMVVNAKRFLVPSYYIRDKT
jgi:hypothetical protein